MNIINIQGETAIDLIALINSLQRIQKSKTVEYNDKSGRKIKYSYITLDDILDKIKENDNLALMQPLGNIEGKPSLQCIIIHKNGDYIISDPFLLDFKDNHSSQDKGSIITYMRRYALASFLGLSSEDDTDGNNPLNEIEELESQEKSKKDKEIAKLQAKGNSLIAQIISKHGSADKAYEVIGLSKEDILAHFATNPEALIKHLEKHAE